MRIKILSYVIVTGRPSQPKSQHPQHQPRAFYSVYTPLQSFLLCLHTLYLLLPMVHDPNQCHISFRGMFLFSFSSFWCNYSTILENLSSLCSPQVNMTNCITDKWKLWRNCKHSLRISPASQAWHSECFS